MNKRRIVGKCEVCEAELTDRADEVCEAELTDRADEACGAGEAFGADEACEAELTDRADEACEADEACGAGEAFGAGEACGAGNEISLRFDWHTHTVYSHGKGTIEENVLEARRRGLSSIAITDHGPGHFGYGFRRRDIPRMRAEIDELNKKYDDIEIYMSVEANIINPSGQLDVKPEEFELYDFVIAGYHFGTLGRNPFASLILHARNLISAKRGKYSDSLKRKNTDMVVNSVRNNNLRTLTHPGDKGAVFMEEVIAVCEETGTLMEISNRHRQLTTEEIVLAAKSDVKFIIGSDAHVSARVGTCENALNRVKDAGLSMERVINL